MEKTTSERLREYNDWRRGSNDIEQPAPKILGDLIDSAANEIEVLRAALGCIVYSGDAASSSIARDALLSCKGGHDAAVQEVK